MSQHVPPQRATRDEVRARYHGMDEHERAIGPGAVWIGLQGVVLAVVGGLMVADLPAKAAAFGSSVILIAAAIGILRAAEWGRRLGGITSLLLAAFGLAWPFLLRTAGGSSGHPKYLVVLIGLSTGIYLLLPSTGVKFRQARESRERARAGSTAT